MKDVVSARKSWNFLRSNITF